MWHRIRSRLGLKLYKAVEDEKDCCQLVSSFSSGIPKEMTVCWYIQWNLSTDNFGLENLSIDGRGRGYSGRWITALKRWTYAFIIRTQWHGVRSCTDRLRRCAQGTTDLHYKPSRCIVPLAAVGGQHPLTYSFLTPACPWFLRAIPYQHPHGS